ncbi:hypothetical protein D3C71_1820070 [compost metagenome]
MVHRRPVGEEAKHGSKHRSGDNPDDHTSPAGCRQLQLLLAQHQVDFDQVRQKKQEHRLQRIDPVAVAQ